ncbi:MAG: YggT family protein [Acidobacteria bacterium]|nr:YggT family protein [Acidobacteriota bacterium]
MSGNPRPQDPPETVPDPEEQKNARRHIEAVLQRELAREAEQTSPDENREVKAVAHELKEHVIAGISESEQLERKARSLSRAYQFIDFVFYIAYALIGLLIGLELLGARDRTGFMQFLRTVTAPLVAPFKGVMPDPSIGSFQLMMSYIIALVVYMLIHQGVRRFFSILAHRAPVKM